MQTLLSRLPQDFSYPVIVVQHLPPKVELDLQLVFGRQFAGRLVEVQDKMPLESAVYFAPPDYHVLIERDGTLSLSQDDPVSGFRPSIDVLFESAAWALGESAVGILLTGANEDGARGLAQIQRRQGRLIVQSLEEAEFRAMPEAGLATVPTAPTMRLAEIAAWLAGFQRGGHA